MRFMATPRSRSSLCLQRALWLALTSYGGSIRQPAGPLRYESSHVAATVFARSLAAAYGGPGKYSSEHDGVTAALRADRRGDLRLTFLPKGKRWAGARVGYFRVGGAKDDTLRVRHAFWYDDRSAYPWLKSLRASAVVIWLWRLNVPQGTPKRIIHEDVENAQTIKVLMAMGAGSDRTYELEGVTIDMLCTGPYANAKEALRAARHYFCECPNGKMTRYICEELRLRLRRLSVQYPFDPDGYDKKQPTVILDLD